MTEVSFENKFEIDNAVRDVHNEKSENSWLMLSFVESTNPRTKWSTIRLQAIGSEIEDLVSHLHKKMFAFILVRVLDKYDGYDTYRYAYIYWIGEELRGIDQAKVGVKKGAIEKALGHWNVELQISDFEDMTMENIMKKVQDASGTRDRTSNIGDDNQNPKLVSYHSVHSQTAEKASRRVLHGDEQTKQTKHFVPIEKQGMEFINEYEIRDAIAAIRNDNDPTDWLLLEYAGRDQVKLSQTGTGGLESLKEVLDTRKVQYAMFRTIHRVDKTDNVRFIVIRWVGENVPPTVRARVITHKGMIDDIFNPVHISIDEQSLTSLTSQSIKERLKKL
ncbi:coactosin [Anaeramoeba ignava]|uniref:Coactosin n=1 Tax=Anaeramoeba ignava TaxID=1746090 RepID=A0A9Q0R6H5_ANAIG|nr:coactosin [Anaeramoeba ignava]